MKRSDRMKVLIAEDSGLLRKAVARMATQAGFTAVEAENGAEALAKLRKCFTDTALIILDWNMPIMSGYEALQKIRSQADYVNIPVLMATAEGTQDDVVMAMKAGATSYLVKPFKKEAMIAKIEKMTGRERTAT